MQFVPVGEQWSESAMSDAFKALEDSITYWRQRLAEAEDPENRETIMERLNRLEDAYMELME
jgi:hypothetical protein